MGIGIRRIGPGGELLINEEGFIIIELPVEVIEETEEICGF
jgi:hypothetical protein